MQPFKPGNILTRAAPDAAFRFAGEPPRLTGEYWLYPVFAAAFQALAAAPPDKPGAYIRFGFYDGLDTIFKKLNDGEVDLIFGSRPGPKQLAAMREAALRYTLTPLLRNALVFFVHKDNPAAGLTQEQLRAVYSGRATSWRELGVPLDAPLHPYQSGRRHDISKGAFARFMGGAPIMKPIKEKKFADISTYEVTADYRNSPGAIGFTLRFLAGSPEGVANKLTGNPNIKFLTIDGVAPTVENIQSGSYPLTIEAYAITARPREGNVARMIDFLRSAEGRRLIEAGGYAPAPPGAEDVVLE